MKRVAMIMTVLVLMGLTIKPMPWLIMASLGLILIGIACLMAMWEHRWLRRAKVVLGTVVKLETLNGRGGDVYAPRFRFTALDGSQREFMQHYYSAYPVALKAKQKVAVAYDARFTDMRIITFWQRYKTAAIVATIGSALVFMAMIFSMGEALVPGIYWQRQSQHG